MDFPIENGGSFHSYVSLPEGKTTNQLLGFYNPWPFRPPRKGDKVTMTGWEMGQKFHGGHAEYASVKVRKGWSRAGWKPGLVNIQKTMERSTIFDGKTMENHNCWWENYGKSQFLMGKLWKDPPFLMGKLWKPFLMGKLWKDPPFLMGKLWKDPPLL